MKNVNGQLIESVKLTLNELIDADVIGALNAMPYRTKSRLIVNAIRAMYRANADGELVIVNGDPPKRAERQSDAKPDDKRAGAKASGGKIKVEEF